MANGVKATTLGSASLIDDIIGNRQGSTSRISTSNLAAQLAADGPLADLITSSTVLAQTWSDLSGKTGAFDGQGGEVLDSDGGTHSQATGSGYDGASVNNAGRYAWRASWSRWVRIGGTGLSSKASNTDLAAASAAALAYSDATIAAERTLLASGAFSTVVTSGPYAESTAPWSAVNTSSTWSVNASGELVISANSFTTTPQAWKTGLKHGGGRARYETAFTITSASSGTYGAELLIGTGNLAYVSVQYRSDGYLILRDDSTGSSRSLNLLYGDTDLAFGIGDKIILRLEVDENGVPTAVAIGPGGHARSFSAPQFQVPAGDVCIMWRNPAALGVTHYCRPLSDEPAVQGHGNAILNARAGDGVRGWKTTGNAVLTAEDGAFRLTTPPGGSGGAFCEIPLTDDVEAIGWHLRMLGATDPATTTCNMYVLQSSVAPGGGLPTTETRRFEITSASAGGDNNVLDYRGGRFKGSMPYVAGSLRAVLYIAVSTGGSELRFTDACLNTDGVAEWIEPAPISALSYADLQAENMALTARVTALEAEVALGGAAAVQYLTPFVYPEGYALDVPFGIFFDVYSGRYITDLLMSALIRPTSGEDIHVSRTSGDDGNDGSEGSPLATPAAAFGLLNASGEARTIILEAGDWFRDQVGDWVTPAQDFNLVVAGGGEATLIAGAPQTGWTQDATYPQVWFKDLSFTPVRALDRKDLDEMGRPRSLEVRGNVATAAASPRRVHIAGSRIYVHAFDGREPDADILVLDNSDGFLLGDIDCYVEGVRFWGGVNGTRLLNGADVSAFKRCEFGYGNANNAISVLRNRTAIARVIFGDCRAYWSASADGFNVHDRTSGIAVDSFFLFCIGHHNGLWNTSSTSSNNGFTVHDSGHGLMLGCLQVYNKDRNGHHVGDDTQMLCIACGSGGAQNPSADPYQNGDFVVGHPDTPSSAKLWLVDCYQYGSPSKLTLGAYNGATLYHRGGRFDALATGGDGAIERF